MPISQEGAALLARINSAGARFLSSSMSKNTGFAFRFSGAIVSAVLPERPRARRCGINFRTEAARRRLPPMAKTTANAGGGEGRNLTCNFTGTGLRAAFVPNACVGLRKSKNKKEFHHAERH